MAKKNKSGSSWAVPFVIATTALVALLGVTTKGYTDWTFGITNEETPTTEEVPTTSEEPGTSEELPGTSEDIPNVERYSVLYEGELDASDPEYEYNNYPFASNSNYYSVSLTNNKVFGIGYSNFFGKNKIITIELSLATNSEITVGEGFAIALHDMMSIEGTNLIEPGTKLMPGTEEEKKSLCDCGYCDTSLVFKTYTIEYDLTDYLNLDEFYFSIELNGYNTTLGTGETIFVDYLKIIGDYEFNTSSSEELMLSNNSSSLVYNDKQLNLGDEIDDYL